MFRLTLRATDESVPPVMIKAMEERLSIGNPTQPEESERPSKQEIADTFGNVLVQ